MTTARFQPAGWIPAALIDALQRIEEAAFNPNLAPTAAREEIRQALRQARDALTDADATYRANITALNNAHDLTR